MTKSKSNLNQFSIVFISKSCELTNLLYYVLFIFNVYVHYCWNVRFKTCNIVLEKSH